MSEPAGCIVTKRGSNISLKKQNVYLSVKNQIADFTVHQTYFNTQNDPAEVIFTFPTPSGASIYSFEAKNDEGLVIISQVKEKGKAKEEYKTAVIYGDRAFYAQRESGDVFSLAIGNLAPLSGVEICIKYVVELKNEIDHTMIRIIFPLTIMPRYTPKTDTYSNHKSVNPAKIDHKPFDMSIAGDIMLTDGIVSLDSKTHKIKISEMKENSLHFEIQDLEQLDRDIVLTLARKDSKSHALTQMFNESISNNIYKYCTMVNVIPDFKNLPPVNISNVHYVILLDSSGSMSMNRHSDESDMEICKKAAKQFVGLLPVGCTFDVYTFSDGYQMMSGEFETTNAKKIAVTNWISKIEAGGGTELLPVLEEIYTTLKKIAKPGVIVVLSDGGITNTESVFNLVKKNPNASVFSIGIGKNVSQELINGLAIHGNGYAEFIGSGDKNILQKVRAQLKRSQDTLRKYQTDYSIDVKVSAGSYKTAPEKLPSLYERTNNMIYVFSEYQPDSITYTEKLGESEAKIELVPNIVEDSNFALHRIAVTKLLEDLQINSVCAGSLERYDDKDTNTIIVSYDKHYKFHKNSDETKVDSNKTEIIQLSTDFNILSEYTASVGIEHLQNKITGEMVLREVPLQSIRYGDPRRLELTPQGCAFGGSYKRSADKKVTSIQLEEKDAKYIVNVSLNGLYLSLGDILSSNTNCTFTGTLLSLKCDLKDTTFILGDIILLKSESDHSLNTYFEIIGLGSVDEPWTLSKCS